MRQQQIINNEIYIYTAASHLSVKRIELLRKVHRQIQGQINIPLGIINRHVTNTYILQKNAGGEFICIIVTSRLVINRFNYYMTRWRI
ncbi:hypothetical protein BK645_10955 [Pseudomonas protegens]|nr:hypothetical protein BK645_10955 [Pseudomonas protegens]ROM37095.1 hypothetical protein BK646_19000 [Pseudomonas protegens]